MLRMENEYERDFIHGKLALSHLLTFSADFAAEVVQQPNFRGVDLEDIVFLDTETTGLAGGAGTLIFLVGLGRFRKGKFQLRQYFLRDPAEEAGMLEALHPMEVTEIAMSLEDVFLECSGAAPVTLTQNEPIEEDHHADLDTTRN